MHANRANCVTTAHVAKRQLRVMTSGAPSPSTRELRAVGAPATLRGGSRVRIRQWHHADRDLLLRAFDRLSPESRYRRLLSGIRELTGPTLRDLTELDHHDREAMIAVDELSGEGIGLARYVRDPRRPEVAELALTVSDDWQGRGVGTLLLDVLCARAREGGITHFTALMLATNRTMRDLLEQLGPVRLVERDGSTVAVEVPNPAVTVSPELSKLVRIAARGEVGATDGGQSRLLHDVRSPRAGTSCST
jgi:GNAT superfamily N-acetyltransferase